MDDNRLNDFLQEFRKKLILKDNSVNEAMTPLIPENEKNELLNEEREFANYLMELKFGEQDTLNPYFIFTFLNEGNLEFILYPLDVDNFDMYEIEAFSTVCVGAMEKDSWQNFLNQMYLGILKNYASQKDYPELEQLELPDKWKEDKTQ